MVIFSINLYKNEQEILRFINRTNQIFLQSNISSIKFLLSCNSPPSDSFLLVCKTINNLMCLQNNNNLGYLNGCIHAFTAFINPNSLSNEDYVVFCNTDIEINKNFFLTLETKQYPSNVGLIGPSIFSPFTNSFSNPLYLKRLSKLKLNFLKIIFSSIVLAKPYFFFNIFKNKFFKKKESKSQAVNQVHGSFFLFSNVGIRALINFNDKQIPFLFLEEAFVSECMRANSLNVYFDSTLKVVHFEHSVIGHKVNRFILDNYVKSISTILEDFYND